MKKINKTRLFVRSAVFMLGVAFPLSFHAQTGTQNPVTPQISITETFNGFTYSKVNGIWKVQDPNTLQWFDIAIDRISIKFSPTATKGQISAFEDNVGLIRKKKNVIEWYHYQLGNIQGSIFDLARTCAANALVEKVNITSGGVYLQTPNDPVSSGAWYFGNPNDTDIDMYEAWNIETRLGSQIKVAIIDGGIDWSHEDLGKGTDSYQNIYLNPGEDAWTNPNDPTTGNGVDDDSNGYIDDWKGWNFHDNNNDTRLNALHGTHTAGIVSAKTNNAKGVCGVAGGWGGSGCKIIPCGAGPQGQPFGDELADAIIYSVQLGARVINVSLGTGPDLELEDAVVYAYEHNVVFVAAAGNDGVQPVGYPANHSLVIGVGGTDQADLRRSSSNYGEHLDMAAPGADIHSTQVGNNYGTSGGTSFSSPLVAGVAALMLSQNPCLGPRQIQDMLTALLKK
jgi:serine protease